MTSGEGVNLVSFERVGHLFSGLIEPGRLDEGAFAINQVHVAKLALATSVLPVADLTFLDYTRLNAPVCGELV